ncbi:hypothetical protein RIF29_04347 [Crotalaria pallida]|uniref:Uncharacterized protein n=1 Tax=Crotalaria pallida TaxID=3830 RepID=A0AAN9J138_CROPI
MVAFFWSNARKYNKSQKLQKRQTQLIRESQVFDNRLLMCMLFTLKEEISAGDTFRGRVCECPVVKGVQYRGDGYTSCEVTCQ